MKFNFQLHILYSRDDHIEWCKTTDRKCGVVVVVKQNELLMLGHKGRISYWCERSGVFRDRRNMMSKVNPHRKRRITGSKKKMWLPFFVETCETRKRWLENRSYL